MEDTNSGLIVGSMLAGVVLIVAAGFGIHACEVADKATLGRAEQTVETQNFEQSEAYRQGTRRDFDELLLQYTHAKSDDERATIRAVMRHRAEACPPELVPQEVRNIIAKGEDK